MFSMAIKVGQRDTGAVTILDLTGKLAGDAGDTLADTVDTLLKGGRNQLVFNLADVSFVDSASLGRLLSLRSCVIGDGGKIKLLNPSERISDLMVTTKLELMFDTFESEADAIQSFS